MFAYVIFLCVLSKYSNVNALWDSDISCPMVCTCRLEHLSETAIHRFTQKHKDSLPITEADNHVNNEVLYEDDFESEFMEDTSLLHAVTCILQTETDVLDLLEKIPKDTNSLALIQGVEAGNKTIKFSDLKKFIGLTILELQGTKPMNESVSNFYCDIDTPLHDIKYLNFDKVFIKTEIKEFTKLESKIHKEEVTFEYKQQLNPKIPPLTLLENGAIKEILPYNKYIEDEGNEIPLFLGFTNLILLRISDCDLNNIDWEMFEGLITLQHLILEKNKLKYIPDFAFYGTPKLKSLSLAYNNLLNIQLTDLAGLLELEYLDLSHNNFSQLSELSFPPFPKLKLANFKNNPIGLVYPNTFEVMNTTDSLILGGEETPFVLMKNSFLGLKMLNKLILHNLVVPKLYRELLVGMPNLNELIMSGNISELEYDSFLDVHKIEKLVIAKCALQNISMDAFIGLQKLKILDLSQNKLKYLPPGTFDPLVNVKELYLNNNKFVQLPREIFSYIHPKLIRLNDNPWHCSCKLSDWKPIMINKIKHKTLKHCDYRHDKRVSCNSQDKFDTKYVFDTKVAPKCATPKKFINWSVFHVMRKQLKCTEYRPKIKKKTSHQNHTETISTSIVLSSEKVNMPEKSEPASTPTANAKSTKYLEKMEKLKKKMETQNKIDTPVKISLFPPEVLTNNDEINDLNYLHLDYSSSNKNYKTDVSLNNNSYQRVNKIKKHKKVNHTNDKLDSDL